MKLFSKIAFFFNLAFLFAIVMRMIERRNSEAVSPMSGFQALENTLIVMGYSAILINLVFLIAFLIARVGVRAGGVPRWIWIFNCCIFIVQIFYFFVLP